MIIEPTIKLLCGSIAFFDTEIGIGYRCKDCMSVAFSIGMPQHCKDLYEKQQVWENLSK